LALDAKINTILTVESTALWNDTNPLSLDPAGAEDVAVATVRFKSNRVSWGVKIESTNGGYLSNPGSKKIAYGLILVGSLKSGAVTMGAYDLDGWTTQLYTATSKTTDTTNGDTFSAKIKYAEDDGTNWQDDTHYTDTVIITVTAN